MSTEVRTDFTGDASSLAEATKKAQEGINGVLQSAEKAGSTLGQMNQIVELAAKAQKGLTAASAFLTTGTAAVTAAVKAQTVAFLTSPLAPIAVAVMALGAAYAYFSSELEAANKKVEESAKLSAEAQKSSEALGKVRTQLADEEALATGTTTQAQLHLRDSIAKVTDIYGPKIEAQKKAIEKAEAEGKSTDVLVKSLAGLETQQAKLTASAQTAYDAGEKQRQADEAKRKAADAAAKAATRLAAVQKLLRTASDVVAEGLSEEEQEAHKAAQRIADLTDEAKRLHVPLETVAPAIEAINKELADTKKARAFAKSMEEATEWAEGEFAPSVDKAAVALGSFREGMDGVVPPKALTDLEKLTILQADLALAFSKGEISAEQYGEAVAEVNRAIAEDTKKTNKAAAEAIVAAYTDIAGQLGDVASEIGSRFEDALSETQGKIEEIDSQLSDLSENSVNASELSGEALVQAYKDGEVAAEDLSAAQKKTIKDRLNAEKKALKEKEAAEKKAALAAFRIAQATAIVQTIIATAQGVMSAFQLGPIAGAIAAVAIGALGAVQVGLIASEQPSFAAGGFLNGAATTGTPVTMHPNEAVLSQQGRAMMGDDAIRDANAGRGGRGRQTGQIVYKNRAFNYFMSDHLNTNGALARTIRKGDRVGLVGRGRRV